MTSVFESEKNLMGEDQHLYDESEAEEALSLCDLALGGDWEDLSDYRDYEHRRSSSEELFQFFNDLNSQMRVAEDIIFCGKLISYTSPALSNYSNKNDKGSEERCSDLNTESFFHCRSNSMSEFQRSELREKDQFLKSEYSLDYLKLKKATSPTTENERNRIQADKSLGRKVPVSSSLARSRWKLLMFGLMKSPSEMKLNDIRNRQSRRNPSSMFTWFDGGETVSVKRGKKGKARSSWWRLLRALGLRV